MDFKANCEKNGIPTVEIRFDVTTDIYNYLIEKCSETERGNNLKGFMRDMVDYFIENDTD